MKFFSLTLADLRGQRQMVVQPGYANVHCTEGCLCKGFIILVTSLYSQQKDQPAPRRWVPPKMLAGSVQEGTQEQQLK